MGISTGGRLRTVSQARLCVGACCPAWLRGRCFIVKLTWFPRLRRTRSRGWTDRLPEALLVWSRGGSDVAQGHKAMITLEMIQLGFTLDTNPPYPFATARGAEGSLPSVWGLLLSPRFIPGHQSDTVTLHHNMSQYHIHNVRVSHHLWDSVCTLCPLRVTVCY